MFSDLNRRLIIIGFFLDLILVYKIIFYVDNFNEAFIDFLFSFFARPKKKEKKTLLPRNFCFAKPPPKLSVELRSPGFLSFCSPILRKKGTSLIYILNYLL